MNTEPAALSVWRMLGALTAWMVLSAAGLLFAGASMRETSADWLYALLPVPSVVSLAAVLPYARRRLALGHLLVLLMTAVLLQSVIAVFARG